MSSDVRLPQRKYALEIHHFVILMIVVLAIQGTYLGYFVGILTTLERRFGISSEKSGFLLSLYDIGHTVAILIIGYFCSKSHLPVITGVAVILSALSMFLLSTPVFFFGTITHDVDILMKHREEYFTDFKCDPYRELSSQGEDCRTEHKEQTTAYVLLSVGQILAGVFAAPFNTLAYVYIDTNVRDRRQSPFLLGLLTSMYAFGPALGFALSAGLTRVYTTLGEAPPHVNVNDEHWIGAWWLGFVLCGILYLLTAIPFFFFPKTYKIISSHEGVPLRPHLPPAHFHEVEHPTAWQKFVISVKEFPYIVWDLVKNPVFVSMVVGWMFGSYLIGGYQTYLPKYLETQYGRSASAADVYAGFINIGAVASSTAIGGYILTRFDVPPRRAMLYLILAWSIIVATYLLGILVGCDQTSIEGLKYNQVSQRWNFLDTYEHSSSCSSECQCQSVFRLDAVHFDGQNFFSPCHAGCYDYDAYEDVWSGCGCALGGRVEKGLIHEPCNQMFIYLAIMFFGLFFGNIFFMVTMMIVLRSVYDDQKVMALSLASCFTNAFGFIPAPIIFGSLIDSSCTLWNSRCPNDRGNCVIYDNAEFRISFHLGNAFLQLMAIVAVIVCYLMSRNRKLPEEEIEDELEQQEMQPLPTPTNRKQSRERRVTDF